jgi:hypothetical protein
LKALKIENQTLRGELSELRQAMTEVKAVLAEQRDMNWRAGWLGSRRGRANTGERYGRSGRYEEMGFEGLHDKTPTPRPRWNKIPQAVHDEVLEMALTRTDLSPRELACHYTDEKRYFVSESSV